MKLLEQSMWQMRKDFANNNDSYIWQDNKVFLINGAREHVVGPFKPYQMTYFSPNNFDISFNFIGYQYNLSKQILRLERAFPKLGLKYSLVNKGKANFKNPAHTILYFPQIVYRERNVVP